MLSYVNPTGYVGPTRSASFPTEVNDVLTWFAHVLRHTTALHLLQAGVDLAVIALWLGHESIETTHGYLEIDLAHKEQALHKLAPVEGPLTRFTAPDPLLAFLAAL